VFAPGAGRPLAVGGGLLVLGGLAEIVRLLPFSYGLVALLLVGAVLWAFFATFFRDPERVPAEGVVSAADGIVRAVETDGDRTRISDGGAGYRPAYRPDADRNVARTYDLETTYGPVRVVQITGIVARRLVAFVRPGDVRRRGDRFGMIVLGSRVDVLLPSARLAPTVRVGERVWAGRSTIARERT
jgi:phosphatidylserine decarboxylase